MKGNVTSERAQQDGIAEMLVKHIRSGELDFTRNNRKRRRANYVKIIREYSKGKQILLQYLNQLISGLAISAGAISIWVVRHDDESELERKRKEEIWNDMQFIKQLVVRKK